MGRKSGSNLENKIKAKPKLLRDAAVLFVGGIEGLMCFAVVGELMK